MDDFSLLRLAMRNLRVKLVDALRSCAAFGCLLPCLLISSATAVAAELKVGAHTEIATLDPMFNASHENQAMARHIFDPLILQNSKQQLIPGLATSWASIGDSIWEIKLRPGVRFHDGAPLTAEDVVYSFERVANVPNNPSPYTPWTSSIKHITIVDPLTLHFETNGPAPALPRDLGVISIVSKKASEQKTTADFNRGTAAIGTGPYRLLEWIPGDHVTLERNPDYWGPPQPWDRVVFKPILSGAARTAALLSGDVDLIDDVSPEDLPSLRANPNVTLAQVPSSRVMYLILDTDRDRSPGVTDSSGVPLDRNPLKDLRVRQAITRAINRDALTERLLEGQAVSAGQLVLPTLFGASDKLPPLRYDADGARRLLEEAGYANGFGLTLAASNDRYPKDAEVALAIAQMLTRVGIVTHVETMPAAVLFTRGTKLEFSFMMAAYVLATGEGSDALRHLVATYDATSGFGAVNRGRYSNPELDRILKTALRTLDDKERGQLLARANEMAINDVAIIPLYFFIYNWAMRKGLEYDAPSYGYTLAMNAKQAQR